MFRTKDLFDLSHTAACDYLSQKEYPWEILPDIKNMIISLGNALDKSEYKEISDCVWVHITAVIAPTAFISAPCIIGKNSEIRHCAFIRGSALIGDGCVIGNSSEIKNSILFNGVQVPHYNYVGDSVLGFKAHMGAGVITSNVKSDKSQVTVKFNKKEFKTGLRKCGAFLGDFAEIGCNAVLNPGTVIGRNTNIYPLSSVRGVVPDNSIYKSDGDIVDKY